MPEGCAFSPAVHCHSSGPGRIETINVSYITTASVLQGLVECKCVAGEMVYGTSYAHGGKGNMLCVLKSKLLIPSLIGKHQQGTGRNICGFLTFSPFAAVVVMCPSIILSFFKICFNSHKMHVLKHSLEHICGILNNKS